MQCPYIDGDCLVDTSDSSSEAEPPDDSEEEGAEFEADLVNFQTPPPLAAYMASLIPVRYRRSLVIEPTPGAGNLLVALGKAGFTHVEAPPGDFFRWTPTRQPKVVLGNPPWSPMQLAYEILERCLADFEPQFVVMLMPWLTLINSDRRTRMLREFGLRKVLHVPRSLFPGIRAQCCILVLEKGYAGEVKLGFYR